MKCQHEWRHVPPSNIRYGYFTCDKCDADISETQYESIQQARREGWEQGKRGAEGLAQKLYDKTGTSTKFDRGLVSGYSDVRAAIAAMEYKGVLDE